MMNWLRYLFCDCEQYDPSKDPLITKGIKLSKRIDLLLSIDPERRQVSGTFIPDLVREGVPKHDS